MEILSNFGWGIITHLAAAGATMLGVWLYKIWNRRCLRTDVEKGYRKLRLVCEPDTINPEQPGNAAFMKSDARDFVNILDRRLRKAGFYPPPECSRDDDRSFQEWFQFLGGVRNLIARSWGHVS